MAIGGNLASGAEAKPGLTSPARWSWVGVALVTVAVALLFIRGFAHPASGALFRDLAVALQHGRLYVDSALYDTAPYRGRNYVPLGPLPAVVMLPLVAAGGILGREAWLALAALALTVPALLVLFREAGIGSGRSRSLLCLATLAGTTYVSALVVDSSYFIAGLVVVALLAWALVLALQDRWPLAAGLLVGLATMTRAPAVVAVMPLVLLYVEKRRPAPARTVAMLLAGVAPAIVTLALYNAARFGSPLESGYGLQALAFEPLRVARAQGVFALNHVPRNIYYLLLSPPGLGLQDTPGYLRLPLLTPSDWGTGLVWISPWLFWATRARGRRAAILAGGAALLVLPSLLYYGVGWIQFGYRYALDGLPFLAALAAMGWQRTRNDRLFAAAVVYSIAANLAGATWLLWRLGA